VGAFAGLAAVRVFVAAPDSAFAGLVLVARFPGAEPLAGFAAPAGFAARAAVFLAGVLVAVRFTGSSVAGRALSLPRTPFRSCKFRWTRSCTIEKHRLCRILAVDLAAIRDAAAVDHCNDSVRYRRVSAANLTRGCARLLASSGDIHLGGHRRADDACRVLQRGGHHRRAVLQQRNPLVGLRLIPPPAMNRSGQIAFSIATRTLVTSFVQRS